MRKTKKQYRILFVSMSLALMITEMFIMLSTDILLDMSLLPIGMLFMMVIPLCGGMTGWLLTQISNEIPKEITVETIDKYYKTLVEEKDKKTMRTKKMFRIYLIVSIVIVIFSLIMRTW